MSDGPFAENRKRQPAKRVNRPLRIGPTVLRKRRFPFRPGTNGRKRSDIDSFLIKNRRPDSFAFRLARYKNHLWRCLMQNLVSRFIRDESGATAIEYGLIAALIAVVIIGALQAIGTNLNNVMTNVAGNLK
jgi:pilus assembly protein Flp/PilA